MHHCGRHIGITLPFLVLRTGGSRNDGCIHDGAIVHKDLLRREDVVHHFEEDCLEFVRFQQMTEFADRRLVRDGVTEEIHLQKFLEGTAIVDGLFHPPHRSGCTTAGGRGF